MEQSNRPTHRITLKKPERCLMNTPPKRHRTIEMPDNGNAPRKVWPRESIDLDALSCQMKGVAVSLFE